MKAWLKGGLIGIGISLIFLLTTFISGFLRASDIIILFSVAIIFLAGGFIIGIFISFIIGKIRVKKKNRWIVIGVIIGIIIIITIYLYSMNKPEKEKLCSEEQRNIQSCPEIYNPVCGCSVYRGDLETFAPVPPVCMTFENSCFACKDKNITYWTEGGCSVEKIK